MTSNGNGSTTNSDSTQPSAHYEPAHEGRAATSCSSYGSSDILPAGKTISLYGMPQSDISITYNTERELRRLANRRANEQPRPGSSFASLD